MTPKALQLLFPTRTPMEWLPNIEVFFPHLISKALNEKVTLALNRAKCFNMYKFFF